MPNEFKVKNGLIVDQGGALITGSSTLSGSVTITGSLNAASITGSLLGTASWAINANSASNSDIFNVGNKINLKSTPTLNSTSDQILVRNTGSGDIEYSSITSLYNTKNLIYVGLSGSKGVAYNSIKAAVNSITDASETNTYTVRVGSGIFYETEIQMKSWITVKGDSSTTTVVSASNPSASIFIMADQSMVIDMQIQGSTATTASAVVYSSNTTPQRNAIAYVENVRFGTNYTNAKVIGSGSSGNCILQCSNVKYGGYTDATLQKSFDVGFHVTSGSSGGIGRMQLRNVTSTNGGVAGTDNNQIFALADATGCTFIVNGCLLTRSTGVARGTAFKVYNGGSLRLTGVNFQRWINGIWAPQTGSAPSIDAIALNFENCTTDVLIEHTGSTGKIQGTDNFLKTQIALDAPLYEVGQDPRKITVGKKGADFTSISASVAYITDSGENNRYVIEVGPGQFTEKTIDLTGKPYVSIVGSNIQTTQIFPSSSNQHIIKMGINNEVSFLSLANAGPGYSALYVDDVGDFAQAHKISIYDCDRGITVDASTTDTQFYGEYIDINGTFEYGVYVSSSNGASSYCNLENYYLFPSASAAIGNYATGPSSSLNLYTSLFKSDATANSIAVKLENGSTLEAAGLDVQDWDYGYVVPNTGIPPLFRVVGSMIHDSVTYDFDVQNAGTIGRYQGVSDHSKINNVSEEFYWNFLDDTDGENDVTRKLSVTFADGTHTDATTLIFKGSSMGVLEGGEITISGSLTITTAAGYGYLHDPINPEVFKRFDWVNSNLTLLPNSNNYIYIDNTGTLVSSPSTPNFAQNIILGRVVTNSTGVEFIDQSPWNAEHTPNRLSKFNREALGPVFSEGSIVTENVTPFKLDVTQGSYYFSENNFLPAGTASINLNQYYISASTWARYTSSVVPNNVYTSGSTLTPMSASYYTKHTVYLVGDGADEEYFLVINNNQYSSLISAENADLPTIPTYFNDGVVPLAAVYVQSGSANITQIQDIRPIIGFRAAGVNASAVHGNLLGLDSDDHAQYLLVNGTRQMAGDLNLGTNDITNVTSISATSITGSIRSTNGVVSGSSQIDITQTTGYTTFSQSLATTDTTQTTNITITSQSAWGAFQSASAYSASAATVDNAQTLRLNSLETFTSSVAGTNVFTASIASTNTFTQSAGLRLNALETASASVISRLGSIESFTSSFSASNFQTDVTQSLNITIVSQSAWGAFQSASAYSASAATIDGGQDLRLNSIETFTASTANSLTALNLSTASLNSKTGSYATTGSNTFTGNQTINGTLNVTNIVVTTITASTEYASGSTRFGSNNSNTHEFTGSVKITGSLDIIGPVTGTSFSGQINANNGVVSGSSQIDITATTNYTTFSSSNATVNNGQNLRLNSLETFTASVAGTNTFTASIATTNTFTQSAGLRLNALETASASAVTRLGNLETFTGSFSSSNYQTDATQSARLNSLETFTASVAGTNAFTASIAGTNTFTQSANLRLNALETSSASVISRVGSLESFTSSFSSSNFQTDVTQSARLNALENFTASVAGTNTFTASIAGTNTFTASIAGTNIFTASIAGTNTFTASANNSITSLNSKTGSYATTGSNTFIGNQIISGNVFITSSLIIGSASLAPENTLIVGVSPNGGTGEGGQILLVAPGGTYTSASMLDNYQNKFRVLRGTNAGSDAYKLQIDLHSGQIQLPNYNSSTAFVGTPVGYLAFDNSGNIITSSGSAAGGSGTPGGSNTQIQYNNGGAFGGVPVLTYDGTTLRATGSFTGSFTGSLEGTASWATNAISSSYPIAVSGSTLYSVAPYSTTPIDSVNSIFIGKDAASGSGYSINMIAIGTDAGKNQWATDSVFIGTGPGSASNDPLEAVAIGYYAGAGQYGGGAGERGVFIGSQAGYQSYGFKSTFIGHGAGYLHRGFQTVAIGNYAGRNVDNNTRENVFIGEYAAAYAHNANYSVIIGNYAGYQAENASYSNIIGYTAGDSASAASYSNLIGYQAGARYSGTAGIGSNNIIIGTNITLADGRNNAINLGGIIFGTGSYSTTTGAPFSGSANGRIGINVVNPQYTLDVSGSGNFTNGLTVTGSLIAATITGSLQGTASWATNAITSSYPLTFNNTNLYSLAPFSNIPENSTSSIYIGENAGTGSGFGIKNAVVIGNNAGGFQYSPDGVYIGTNAGYNAYYGDQSIFIGKNTGKNSGNGRNSVFIGNDAGIDNGDGDRAVNIGLEAGIQSNAFDTIFIGYGAGGYSYSNHGIYLGYFAGESTAGDYNIAMGRFAGLNAFNSSNVIFLGQSAGNEATDASNSIFMGLSAGYSASNASNSIFIGNSAGARAINASNSIILGEDAGYRATNNLIGRNNIIIGTKVTLENGRQDSINIGGIIFGTGSYYSAAAGNAFSGSANGKIGINVVNPQYTLDVSGSGNFTNGVTASLFGTASWATNAISSSYPIALTGSTLRSVSPNAGIGGSTDNSIFFGSGSGYNTPNVNNSNFFGQSAGASATNASVSNFFGQEAGYGATDAFDSNFFGYRAGYLSTDADSSNYMGPFAGAEAPNAGQSNFFGYGAGQFATNAANSNFLGYYAGYSASSAYSSNFLGANAGEFAKFANNSNFLGLQSGKFAIGADHSNFFGHLAGYSASNAYEANFIGWRAGWGAEAAGRANFIGSHAGDSAIYADSSNFIGDYAGYNAQLASYSNFIGSGAGYNALSASNSIIIGYEAGFKISGPNHGLGQNNIIIGTKITLPDGRRDSINIGGIIFGTGSYSYTGYGDSYSGAANGKIGINVVNPQYTLDVSGNGNFTNGLTVTGSSIITSITGSLLSTNGVVSGSSQVDITATTNYTSFSQSLAGTDASQSLRLDSIELKTGSYATTGSNSFVGNQSINGTLTVTNIVTTTITASTEYASGSTRFGSNNSNTHEFTGSVKITGSLDVIGTGTFTNISSTSITGSLFGTASFYQIRTGSTGTDVNVVVSPSGSVFNIPDASATARGLVTTGTQTIAGAKTFTSTFDIGNAGGSSNFTVAGNAAAASNTGTARTAFLGQNQITYRIINSNQSAATTLTNAFNYATFALTQLTLTEPSTGNVPLVSQIAVKGLDINNGAGTVDNSATVYIEGPATGSATITNNYALWIDSGSTRLDGDLIMSGSNISATGSISATGGFTGSLFGTASLATTASYYQIVTGSAGTDVNIVATPSGSILNIPDASATARGLVTTGTQTFTGTKTFGSVLFTGTFASNNSATIGSTNLFVRGQSTRETTTVSGVLFGGNTSQDVAIATIATNTAGIPANNGAAQFVFGKSITSTAATGVHPTVANVVIKSATYNNGGAPITNVAALLIDGPPDGTATITNRYALWISGSGVTRLDGDLIMSGSNISATGSINVTGNVNVVGTMTSSLQSGYALVGGPNNTSIAVATSSFGGGSGTPGGSTTQIQYNNGGTFGGVPTLTYDGTTLRASGSFTGSFTGSVLANGTFTASLQSGYALVGGPNNTSIAVATSSFAGSGGGLKTKAGSVANTSFSGNPKKATVTFSTAFTDTNYAITITGEDARSWTIESKLAGSFVINSNSNTGLSGTTYWIATAYGETT